MNKLIAAEDLMVAKFSHTSHQPIRVYVTINNATKLC